MYYALLWLAAVEFLGLIALPLAFRLFHRLPDRGYTLAKPLGILLLTYALWILGLTHLIPNSRYTLIAILLVLALVSLLALRRRAGELAAFLARERVAILAGETVFLALFLLWLFITSHTPAIDHTEKPMDFAFLNAALRSRFFPPGDPWLAGQPVSYYYMGHLMMASLTKLTGIPSSVSYNLAIILIPALVGSAAYGLVYNLIRLSGARMGGAALYALAAPVFLGLIGNLEGVLEFVHARGWGSQGFWQWVSVKGLDGASSSSPGVYPSEHWWWWRATRVIDTVVDGRSLDYTITEFPFFSFLLGDLHPHVSSLPFLILNLALILNLFLSPARVGLGWLRTHPWQALSIALLLGALSFINLWDLPVFAALLAAILFVKSYGERGGKLGGALSSAAQVAVPIFVGAVLLYLPFYITFNSQASGVLPVRDVATRPLHFLLIWGLLLLLALSFLVRQLWGLPRERRDRRALGLVLAVCLAPFVAWAGLEIFLRFFEGETVQGLASVGNRFLRILPVGAIAGVGLYSALLRVRTGDSSALVFPLLFMSLGFYLLMGAELFYLQDLFGNRMNTVFKLYYQAWALLALAAAYGLYYWHSRPLPSRIALRVGEFSWSAAVGVLLLISFYYPVGAALDKAEGFQGRATLDGLAFVEERSPGEYQAIKWLRDEAALGRIVEAVGDDYSAYGRISASTGLPTVLGWQFHELQWRGSSDPFRGRKEDVAEIYRSTDPQQVKALLERYQVRYVYVGPRERTTYGSAGLEKFGQFLRPAFSSGDVVIYERLE